MFPAILMIKREKLHFNDKALNRPKTVSSFEHKLLTPRLLCVYRASLQMWLVSVHSSRPKAVLAETVSLKKIGLFKISQTYYLCRFQPWRYLILLANTQLENELFIEKRKSWNYGKNHTEIQAIYQLANYMKLYSYQTSKLLNDTGITNIQ